MLTREDIKKLRNLKDGEVFTCNLDCGATVEVIPQFGYNWDADHDSYKKLLKGYSVKFQDPRNFAIGLGKAMNSEAYHDSYNHIDVYVDVKALPMLRALILAISPRPELKEVAPATADLVEEG